MGKIEKVGPKTIADYVAGAKVIHTKKNNLRGYKYYLKMPSGIQAILHSVVTETKSKLVLTLERGDTLYWQGTSYTFNPATAFAQTA